MKNYILLGVIFSFIASAMAFLIAHSEYSRHFVNKKQTLKLALEAAVFAFIVFLVLGIFAAFVLKKLI